MFFQRHRAFVLLLVYWIHVFCFIDKATADTASLNVSANNMSSSESVLENSEDATAETSIDGENNYENETTTEATSTSRPQYIPNSYGNPYYVYTVNYKGLQSALKELFFPQLVLNIIPEFGYDRFKAPSLLDYPGDTSELSQDYFTADGLAIVKVGITIKSIRGLDEEEEELQTELDFGIVWQDFRLTLPKTWNYGFNNPVYRLDPKLIDHLWHPHLFLNQLTSDSRPALITPPTTLTSLNNDALLKYLIKSSIVTQCELNYEFYPVDLTICRLDIQSYLYSNISIELEWLPPGKGGLDYVEDVNVPGFYLYISKPMKETVCDDKISLWRAPCATKLYFEIGLKRHISSHVIRTFVPSLLFVFISWLSFLIPDDMATERIGCSCISLLSLMVMLDSIGNAIPQVTYLTVIFLTMRVYIALHIWMICSIVFVFIPFVEVLVILKIWSMEKAAKAREKKVTKESKRESRRRQSEGSCGKNGESKVNNLGQPTKFTGHNNLVVTPGSGETMNCKKSQVLRQMASRIEKITPIAVIMLFILFNFIYWPWLLNGDVVDPNFDLIN